MMRESIAYYDNKDRFTQRCLWIQVILARVSMSASQLRQLSHTFLPSAVRQIVCLPG